MIERQNIKNALKQSLPCYFWFLHKLSFKLVPKIAVRAHEPSKNWAFFNETLLSKNLMKALYHNSKNLKLFSRPPINFILALNIIYNRLSIIMDMEAQLLVIHRRFFLLRQQVIANIKPTPRWKYWFNFLKLWFHWGDSINLTYFFNRCHCSQFFLAFFPSLESLMSLINRIFHNSLHLFANFIRFHYRILSLIPIQFSPSIVVN